MAMPLMARASPPSAAMSESCSRPDRCRQPLHPCRPSSALASTHIGVNAEPVLSFYSSFLSSFFFFYLPMGYPSRPPSLCPIEARPFVRDFHLLIPARRAGGSMVASVADRASQRPKSDTSQGDFQARAATNMRGGQHSSVGFRQQRIKGVGDHVKELDLEPCGEKRDVVEVRVLLRVQMPRRHLLVKRCD